jgi:hypothetical protein
MQPIISLGTGASAEVDLDPVVGHMYIFCGVLFPDQCQQRLVS